MSSAFLETQIRATTGLFKSAEALGPIHELRKGTLASITDQIGHLATLDIPGAERLNAAIVVSGFDAAERSALGATVASRILQSVTYGIVL